MINLVKKQQHRSGMDVIPFASLVGCIGQYPVLSQEDDAKIEICLITQEKIENSHLARIRKVLCFSAPGPDPSLANPSLANSGTVDQ